MSTQQPDDSEARVRLDVWLYAARFFKTRRQAAEAIAAGRVQLNGSRIAKPSRTVGAGDALIIRRGDETFEISVLIAANKRPSASIAAGFYQESEQSQIERQRLREQARLARQLYTPSPHKPDKRDRRRIIAFQKHNQN